MLTRLGQIAEWCPCRNASQPATRITAKRPEFPERAATHTERKAAIENGSQAERSFPLDITRAPMLRCSASVDPQLSTRRAAGALDGSGADSAPRRSQPWLPSAPPSDRPERPSDESALALVPARCRRVAP